MDRLAQPGGVWRRAALILLACAALAAISSSESLHRALIEVLAVTEMLIDQHPVAGPIVFVLAAGFSAMFSFVSIALVVPAAVFAWGAPASVVLLWVGWICGGVITYTIGRRLGRRMVVWLLGDQAFGRIEQRFRRGAPFWVVLLMQLALPSEVPGYVLGVARYPFVRYLAALGIAELPYTVATVYLGASFVERRGMVILVAGIAIALLSVVAFYFLRRMMRTADAGARNGSCSNESPA
jgi:uncharacterized membrane protein YdjX (TVP38/TMEM64 family)